MKRWTRYAPATRAKQAASAGIRCACAHAFSGSRFDGGVTFGSAGGTELLLGSVMRFRKMGEDEACSKDSRRACQSSLKTDRPARRVRASALRAHCPISLVILTLDRLLS